MTAWTTSTLLVVDNVVNVWIVWTAMVFIFLLSVLAAQIRIFSMIASDVVIVLVAQIFAINHVVFSMNSSHKSNTRKKYKALIYHRQAHSRKEKLGWRRTKESLVFSRNYLE